MVSVYQGCDKTGFTCLTKFNNLDNHVGMPYIPLKDPSQTPITN